MKENTCCFTGHRPNVLASIIGADSLSIDRIKIRLLFEIYAKALEGVNTFISGMALGVDMWAAEVVLIAKALHPELNVRLSAAVPFTGQADNWSRRNRARYDAILSRADEKTVLSDKYTKDCMNKRNRFMVDSSAHIIAVYGGKPGGTKNTLEYAIKRGLSVTRIDPRNVLAYKALEKLPPGFCNLNGGTL